MISSKVVYRAVIRYLYLKGNTGKEIHGELAYVYGSSASSFGLISVEDVRNSHSQIISNEFFSISEEFLLYVHRRRKV